MPIVVCILLTRSPCERSRSTATMRVLAGVRWRIACTDAVGTGARRTRLAAAAARARRTRRCGGSSTTLRGARRRFGSGSIGCRSWTSPSTSRAKVVRAARARWTRSRLALDRREPPLPRDRAGLRTVGVAHMMATLGHELFHAIEIAEEPSVVNAETLATSTRASASRPATPEGYGRSNRSGGGGRTARAPAASQHEERPWNLTRMRPSHPREFGRCRGSG